MKNHTPFSYSESAVGFSNFRQGCERLKDHENSDGHRASVRELRHRESLHAQISEHREQQKLRMLALLGLKAHLCTMKTLLRQGVKIRGHHDENSNIYQFNLDKAAFHEGLNTFLKHEKFSVIPFLPSRPS